MRISQPLFPLLYILTLLTIYALSSFQFLRQTLAEKNQNEKGDEPKEGISPNNSPPSSLNLVQNLPHSPNDFNKGNF